MIIVNIDILGASLLHTPFARDRIDGSIHAPICLDYPLAIIFLSYVPYGVSSKIHCLKFLHLSTPSSDHVRMAPSQPRISEMSAGQMLYLSQLISSHETRG